jgi:enoyl-CoA hydratase/carnithine racemase
VTETPSHSKDLGVVRYERDGAIARIVLNWPERANAQSSEMVRQVDSCLDQARQDYGVKVVIVKGEGKGFCAGHVMSPDAYLEFADSQANMGSKLSGQQGTLPLADASVLGVSKADDRADTAMRSAAAHTGPCCPSSRSPPRTPTFRCRWCRASASPVGRR